MVRQPASNAKLSAAARSYDLQSQIGFILRVANQVAVELFTETLDPILMDEKVTTAQFAVLSTAWEFSGINQSELASFVSMDMPTLNGVLKRLVSRGHVLVELSPDDKRRRAIFLSPSGRRLAEQLRIHGVQVSRRILSPLSADEKVTLVAILRKITASRRPV